LVSAFAAGIQDNQTYTFFFPGQDLLHFPFIPLHPGEAKASVMGFRIAKGASPAGNPTKE